MSMGADQPSQPGEHPELPAQNFDPAEHLEKRYKHSYLPLKWQLVWLRRLYPQAEVRTQLISSNDTHAIFQAEIKLPGGGIATGWGAQARYNEGEETGQDFGYLLAAENQALTRALAVLGFGTEWAQDFDLPVENNPIVIPTNNFYQLDDSDSTSIEVPLTPPDPDLTMPEYKPASVQSERSSKTTPRTVHEGPGDYSEQVTGAPVLVDPVIEERLKGVQDSQLRILIKQIYEKARTKYGYSPDVVDKRSRERYGKPAFELDLEGAEEYLERIRSAPQRVTNRT